MNAKIIYKIVFSHLVLASLQLIENSFSFRSDVQFRRIIDQENNIGAVDKPLTRVVEWEESLNLLSNFQNSRNFHNVHLRTIMASFFLLIVDKFVVQYLEIIEKFYPLEQLVVNSQSSKTIQHSLTELLEPRESPIGRELRTVENFRLVAVH